MPTLLIVESEGGNVFIVEKSNEKPQVEKILGKLKKAEKIVKTDQALEVVRFLTEEAAQ